MHFNLHGFGVAALSGVEMVGQTWGGCLGVATEWCGDGGADMGVMSGCGH